jgi:hypothetical protein
MSERDPLPDTFPAGTKFGVWDDIPLSKTPDWVVTAWEPPAPRRMNGTRFIEAKLLSEADFRALVTKLFGSTANDR